MLILVYSLQLNIKTWWVMSGNKQQSLCYWLEMQHFGQKWLLRHYVGFFSSFFSPVCFGNRKLPHDRNLLIITLKRGKKNKNAIYWLIYSIFNLKNSWISDWTLLFGHNQNWLFSLCAAREPSARINGFWTIHLCLCWQSTDFQGEVVGAAVMWQTVRQHRVAMQLSERRRLKKTDVHLLLWSHVWASQRRLPVVMITWVIVHTLLPSLGCREAGVTDLVDDNLLLCYDSFTTLAVFNQPWMDYS